MQLEEHRFQILPVQVQQKRYLRIRPTVIQMTKVTGMEMGVQEVAQGVFMIPIIFLDSIQLY